jgi:hypothetical protein
MASFGGGGGGFEPASLKILKVEKREDGCCWVVDAIELALSNRLSKGALNARSQLT